MLTRWRARLGLTQVDAAGRIGCGQGLYSKWERGKVLPSPRWQRRLHALTGISPNDWILSGLVSAPSPVEAPATQVAQASRAGT